MNRKQIFDKKIIFLPKKNPRIRSWDFVFLNQNFRMFKIQSLFLIALLFIVSSCQSQISSKHNVINIQKIEYYDAARSREIPVAVITSKKQNKIPIIFSHGWGENKGETI